MRRVQMLMVMVSAGLFVACVTVDRARLSEGCKTLYDACLDRCPDENARAAQAEVLATTPAGQSPGTVPSATPVPAAQQRGAVTCTHDCAEQARACR